MRGKQKKKQNNFLLVKEKKEKKLKTNHRIRHILMIGKTVGELKSKTNQLEA
jgi:hypothetical protein